MPAHPLHGIRRVDAGNNGEASEQRPRPPQPAITGDLHKFTRLRSPVHLAYRGEQFRFIFGKSEVGPRDYSVRPGDLRIPRPPVIQIQREIGFAHSLQGNQAETSTRVHDGAIRKRDDHEWTPLCRRTVSCRHLAVFRASQVSKTATSFHFVTSLPIACTLSASEQAGRGDEWRTFLVENVVEVIRSDSSVRLRLADGDDVIVAAVNLARREKACCAFFDFELELLADEVWLRIGAPPEAATMLVDLTTAG
jgi:hypothetical protein